MIHCCNKTSSPYDVSKPVVVIVNPYNNSKFELGTVIRISAKVSDNDDIDYVEFYINDSLVAWFDSQPYTYNWDSKGKLGTSTIRALASDLSGNVGQSDVITIKILETLIPPDTLKPAIEIKYPINNTKFLEGTVFEMSAEVSDNKGIDNVRFYINDSMVVRFDNVPYVYNWDSQGKIGRNTFRVLASDLSGNVGQSDLITIQISEAVEELFLFNYVDDEVIQHPDPAVVEERRIIINKHLFKEKDSLIFNLPENLFLMIYRDKLNIRGENDYSWFGTAYGEWGTVSIISVYNSAISGYIVIYTITPEPVFYNIRNVTDPDPIKRLQTLDPSKYPPD